MAYLLRIKVELVKSNRQKKDFLLCGSIWLNFQESMSSQEEDMKQSCHCFWALDKHFSLAVVFFHTEPQCSLKTLLITVLQIATTTRSQWASRTPLCLS